MGNCYSVDYIAEYHIHTDIPCNIEKPQQNHKNCKTGPEVIKLFSCSTQLSMIFFLLINVKMPTIVGILTFVNRKNSILGLSESEKS